MLGCIRFILKEWNQIWTNNNGQIHGTHFIISRTFRNGIEELKQIISHFILTARKNLLSVNTLMYSDFLGEAEGKAKEQLLTFLFPILYNSKNNHGMLWV